MTNAGISARIQCPLDGRWGPGLTVCKHAPDLPATKLVAAPRADGLGVVAVVCLDCLTDPTPAGAMTDQQVLDAFRLVCRCPRCSADLIDLAQPLPRG